MSSHCSAYSPRPAIESCAGRVAHSGVSTINDARWAVPIPSAMSGGWPNPVASAVRAPPPAPTAPPTRQARNHRRRSASRHSVHVRSWPRESSTHTSATSTVMVTAYPVATPHGRPPSPTVSSASTVTIGRSRTTQRRGASSNAPTAAPTGQMPMTLPSSGAAETAIRPVRAVTTSRADTRTCHDDDHQRSTRTLLTVAPCHRSQRPSDHPGDPDTIDGAPSLLPVRVGPMTRLSR